MFYAESCANKRTSPLKKKSYFFLGIPSSVEPVNAGSASGLDPRPFSIL